MSEPAAEPEVQVRSGREARRSIAQTGPGRGERARGAAGGTVVNVISEGTRKAGESPVIPLLMIGLGAYLMWYGVHYWRSSNTRWPSDPIKSVLQGKGLPPNIPAGSVETEVAAVESKTTSLETAAPGQSTGTGQAPGTTTAGGRGSGGGGTYSFGQLRNYWIMAGGPGGLTADIAAAIALAESAGDPNATNPTDNNGTQTSWGLWQISLGNHNEPSSDWNTPLGNARLAVGKYQGAGNTFSPWGTYVSGAYRKFLQSTT